MQGIYSLKTVFEGFRDIELPPLRRRLIKPGDPRSEELVQWGICVYAYSVVAHLKKILAGLVQLAEAENVAASAPLCRHVFEWAAVSCSLSSKLPEQIRQSDWQGAWILLTQVATASFWVQKYGQKYAGNSADITAVAATEKPIYVPQAVADYEDYQKQHLNETEALETYSFLCDFSHANPVCLARYYTYEENGALIRFADPDKAAPRESFLPFVNRCLIDLLTFLYRLLDMAKEKEIRGKILTALKQLVSLAPK